MRINDGAFQSKSDRKNGLADILISQASVSLVSAPEKMNGKKGSFLRYGEIRSLCFQSQQERKKKKSLEGRGGGRKTKSDISSPTENFLGI